MFRNISPRLSTIAFLFSGLLAFTLVFPANSRAQVVSGTISGTVTDPSSAVIANAHVLVHNDDTGVQRTLITSSAGTFTAPAIPIGSYTVSVDASGFGSYKRTGITLTVGQTLNLNLSLKITGSETLTVQDVPPAVNLSSDQISGLVDARQVKELPLNGRSYDQLLLLNPATVNYTNQRSGSTGTSNSSVGSMFSASGRRPQDNLFLLNGIEYTGASLINTTPGGTSGQLLGIDGIHEFNVVTDTYSASYGKRDGAQISISTTGGTNTLHGSAYEFLRNSFFDARNYFDSPRIPEFQRNDFGASLGGPIRKDKLFLFGNYEGYRQNLGESIVTLVPDNQARSGEVPNANTGVYAPTAFSPISAQLLNLWPVANGPEVTQLNPAGTLVVPTGIAKYIGTAPQHIREDFGTTRFDYTIGNTDTSTASIRSTTRTRPAPRPTRTPTSTRTCASRSSASRSSMSFRRVLLTSRASASRVPRSTSMATFLPPNRRSLPVSGPAFPRMRLSSPAQLPPTAHRPSPRRAQTSGPNNGITRNLLTFDDHAYYTLGKHTLQAGVWLQHLESNDNLAQDQYGQASFASLTTFLNGTIKTFTYAPNTTELGWRTLFADAFIEDTWHITPRLEARIGLRTESSTGWSESQGRASVYTFSSGVINTTPNSGLTNALTTNNALLLPEPRAGFAWNVFGNGHTAITGGAGLHHSLLDALDYRLDQAAPYNTVYAYSGTATTENVANPTGGTGLISPSTVDSAIHTPTLFSYDLKIEQQLAPATSLTIGYSGSHSYHQILNGDLNEPAYTVVNGQVFYPASGTPASPAAPIKANPAVANTTSWWAGGSGNYNALVVDLRHNFDHGLQLRGNYTWSKNLDDGSAWNTSVSSNTPAFVEVPSLPHLDYGPAATDIRNIASINATYELPLGKNKAVFGNAGEVADRFVSGWSVASITTLLSGFPFSPQLGYNPTGSGDSRNPIRPNVNPGFTGPLYPGGSTAQRVAQYFNPAAFSAPAAGYVGNAGRDSLVGPGFADWDFSLLKSTQITERTRLQFRAEFFNILNHTNLQLPNEVVYSAGPTQGTTANQNTVAALGSPGVISATANTSRQIQLGLKLLF